MKTLKQLLPPITILYLLLVAILAVFLFRASPAPETHRLRGVGLGSWEGEKGMTLMSGRHFDCEPITDNPPYTTECHGEIAGNPLIIHTQYDQTNKSTRDCLATYNNQTWSCHSAWRHVHVADFAYIDTALGLNETQLQTLKQQHFFENLPEEPFLTGSITFGVINAILMVLFISIKTNVSLKKWYPLILFGIPVGFFTYYGSVLAAVFLTNGFWD